MNRVAAVVAALLALTWTRADPPPAEEPLDPETVWASVEPTADEGAHAGSGMEGDRPEGAFPIVMGTRGTPVPPSAEAGFPGSLSAGEPLVRRDAAERQAVAAPSRPAAGGSWLRSLGSLVAVIGLIALLAWGYRAAGGGLTALRPRRSGVIELVSRVSLSPRQSLCLVRVGPRMVLVGASGDRLTSLDVIEDAALVAQLAGDAERARNGGGAAFQTLLESQAAQLCGEEEQGQRGEGAKGQRGWLPRLPQRREADRAAERFDSAPPDEEAPSIVRLTEAKRALLATMRRIQSAVRAG